MKHPNRFATRHVVMIAAAFPDIGSPETKSFGEGLSFKRAFSRLHRSHPLGFCCIKILSMRFAKLQRLQQIMECTLQFGRARSQRTRCGDMARQSTRYRRNVQTA